MLGSGTVGTGCILEHGDERWLQPGDEVELEVEGIGVLRNRVGTHQVVKVAVIGGGVMGLATGWALKRRGHEPVVYEQFEVGNPHGSSHGRSRIFRLAYAEDHYVRLAQEALALWRELEAESGETRARAPRPGRDRAHARGEHRPHARALRRRLGAARPG